MKIEGKNVLITGAARRVGRAMALAVAHAGGNVIIHHGHSSKLADELQQEIKQLGRQSFVIQADLNDPRQVNDLFKQASDLGTISGLVNSAAIFEPLSWQNTDLDNWHRHLNINLTAPFVLSQYFASKLPEFEQGRIVNILDWRALRPGADHLPYTISKAGLAALTQSLAIALAPRITVNGLAFGAILPPSDGGASEDILNDVPAQRWADLNEVGEALMFLLDGPTYITGEILHLDGGRHLV
jgi:NAD(P)-dependent dehydrogenase (short-subunit alcohol dehydrogenase family)